MQAWVQRGLWNAAEPSMRVHRTCPATMQLTGSCPLAVGVETLNLEQAGLDELERALDRCQGFVLG